jgi:hypothetical protein
MATETTSDEMKSSTETESVTTDSKQDNKDLDKPQEQTTEATPEVKTETTPEPETKSDQVEGQSIPNRENSSVKVSSIQFNLKDSKIDNVDDIKKYDSFFRSEFYIPDFESSGDTFDNEELMESNYTKSAEAIGTQIHAIAVAICDEDPVMQEGQPEYNPESKFRIHGRIADGRHRYLESKNAGKEWRHEYYRVRNFEEFMLLRSHMDVKKKQSGQEMINKFEQICEYHHETLGIPKPEVCAIVVEKYNPPYAKSSLRHWIKSEYKDDKMAKRREGKGLKPEETKEGKKIADKLQKKADKKLSKKDSKIDELNKTISGNTEEITLLKENQKVLEDSVKEYNDIQPFLTTSQEVTIQGTQDKVVVEIDLKNRNFIVKKV